jgi:hypothetical protein
LSINLFSPRTSRNNISKITSMEKKGIQNYGISLCLVYQLFGKNFWNPFKFKLPALYISKETAYINKKLAIYSKYLISTVAMPRRILLQSLSHLSLSLWPRDAPTASPRKTHTRTCLAFSKRRIIICSRNARASLCR